MSEEKNLTSLWQKVLKETDGILPKEAIKQWILRIVPISLENNELVLAVADATLAQGHALQPVFMAVDKPREPRTHGHGLGMQAGKRQRKQADKPHEHATD